VAFRSRVRLRNGALDRYGVRVKPKGRRPGVTALYDIDTLPAETRAAFEAEAAPAADLEARFLALTEEKRAKAEARAAALRAVARRRQAGETLEAACAAEAAEAGCSPARLEELHRLVKDRYPSEWVWLLADRRKGRPRTDQSAEEFFSWFLARVNEAAQRFPLRKAYDDVAEAWRRDGRKVPFGYECATRRWNALPAEERTRLREGERAAAARHDPIVHRERVPASNEAWCIDGRNPDVSVPFPGRTTTSRFTVEMIADLHSNFFLGWRASGSENARLVRSVV